jgi:hypothetical protein
MSLTLTRSVVQDFDELNQHVWRVTGSVVSDTPGLPSEVFVYHVFPAGDVAEEELSVIASVPQLSEIGLEPVSQGETQVPYYRRADFTLDCRSASEAVKIIGDIEEDLADLVDNFVKAESIETTVTVVIG